MKINALFNPNVRADINRTLFFTPPTQASDIAIILGGGSITGEVARAASADIGETDCYKMGVIVTGGAFIRQPHVYHGLRLLGAQIDKFDCTSGLKETNHAITCMSKRAAGKVILRELSSTNTGENFANIAQGISNIEAQTATVYCPAPTQRRVIDTARLHIPHVTVTTKPVYPWFPQSFWEDKWHKNPVSAHYVLSEYNKIDLEKSRNYYNRGFCAHAPR
jgi:hypothetical protein